AGWRMKELTPPWLGQLAAWEDVLAVIVAREAYLVHRDRDTSRYAEGTRALLTFGASVSDGRYARALDRRGRGPPPPAADPPLPGGARGAGPGPRRSGPVPTRGRAGSPARTPSPAPRPCPPPCPPRDSRSASS